MHRDRIYFLVKDPHWTFIWWDITPETLNDIRAHMDGQMPPLILRVHEYDVFDTTRVHYTFDVPITGDTNHWYLNIWQADRKYLVNIGFKAPFPSTNTGDAPQEALFCVIARSNTIYLPPDGPSDSTEVQWSTLDLRGQIA
ncbi:MAG: DUF4912 domain-containing protein [Anaerolineae bacterium]